MVVLRGVSVSLTSRAYDNRNNGQGFPYTCFGNKNGGWAGGGNNFSGYNFVFDDGKWYHLARAIAREERNAFRRSPVRSINSTAVGLSGKLATTWAAIKAH